MVDMWSCPITAGQYEACFNAFNGGILDLIDSEPVCHSTSDMPQQSDACAMAPCDYIWFD
jgi:hypothetical protein